jgi:hypothetical protein
VKDQALVTGKQIADKIDLSRSGNTLQPVNPARPLPPRWLAMAQDLDRRWLCCRRDLGETWSFFNMKTYLKDVLQL